MLKLPKGLKKKKKKSKKDQELFTEEELEQYKRELKAKQEAAAAKSDAGESDAASDVEGLASISGSIQTPSVACLSPDNTENKRQESNQTKSSEEDEEWAKFKALTSGVDSILHKTQDELDRIKKESFYQRLPSTAEKKRQQEEEAAKREAERIEEEKRKAAEREAQRDKLAEAVVELSESEEDDADVIDDIFATDYIEAITRGEVQLGVVPDSPLEDFVEGPDPFDTTYAEKVIVGADKVKGNKKLVSLGAAVEVLSGRVDREHALALAKPKRKLRKGIQNLLLSESVDFEDGDSVLAVPEPQRNLLDELVADVSEPEQPIDLSVSLHLHLIPGKKADVTKEEDEDAEPIPDLSEFEATNTQEDDEFAELALESLVKKDEVKILTEIPQQKIEVITDLVDSSWAKFATDSEKTVSEKEKPARPPPPARPTSGPHIVEGAIYISDDESFDTEDDIFNTAYAEQVIKKTTVLEEDDEFDPRAEEQQKSISSIDPATDLFDTSAISALADSKTTESAVKADLNHSLSDQDFNPRSEETVSGRDVHIETATDNFETARRKSSLSLNLQSKTVGFLVSDRDLLGVSNENCGNKKPLTPFYAPSGVAIIEKESDDPFDTSFVPDVKPTEVELKHLEHDLLQKFSLKESLSDPEFDPRALPSPQLTEDLLAVKENINTKVLTPAQESKDLPDEAVKVIDPFDTSIASNLKPGAAELKVIENELLPRSRSDKEAGVLDTQTDAQELGLGDKVLTPSIPNKKTSLPEEIDPFDTSIAANLVPGETEIKLLVSELIDR